MLKAILCALIISITGDAVANDGQYSAAVVHQAEHAWYEVGSMKWNLRWV